MCACRGVGIGVRVKKMNTRQTEVTKKGRKSWKREKEKKRKRSLGTVKLVNMVKIPVVNHRVQKFRRKVKPGFQPAISSDPCEEVCNRVEGVGRKKGAWRSQKTQKNKKM